MKLRGRSEARDRRVLRNELRDVFRWGAWFFKTLPLPLPWSALFSWTLFTKRDRKSPVRKEGCLGCPLNFLFSFGCSYFEIYSIEKLGAVDSNEKLIYESKLPSHICLIIPTLHNLWYVGDDSRLVINSILSTVKRSAVSVQLDGWFTFHFQWSYGA